MLGMLGGYLLVRNVVGEGFEGSRDTGTLSQDLARRQMRRTHALKARTLVAFYSLETAVIGDSLIRIFRAQKKPDTYLE